MCMHVSLNFKTWLISNILVSNCANFGHASIHATDYRIPPRKNPPLSIQQQGLLRQRQAHRPCVQLVGESAGLLEEAVGLKPPPAEASGGGSISMGIPRTRPLGPALKSCHQVNQSQQATKNPHQPKPMRVSSQPTHSSRPRASSRPNAKFVNAIIWLKSWRIVKKLTHLT